MHNNRIYAGMIDKGAEFFSVKSRLYCVHNFKIHTWPDLPQKVLEWVENDMLNQPDALWSLSSWENLIREDWTYRYILCRFGGLDDKPDFTDKGEVNHTEYVECELRGTCKYEGKLCCSIKVTNGILTKSEIEVLKIVKQPDKIIASELNISPDTVSTHLQNIRIKTGLKNKAELSIFAYQKGLIKS